MASLTCLLRLLDISHPTRCRSHGVPLGREWILATPISGWRAPGRELGSTWVEASILGHSRSEKPDWGMPNLGSEGKGYCPSWSRMKESLALYLGLRWTGSVSGSSSCPVRRDNAVAIRATVLPGPWMRRGDVWVKGSWLRGSSREPREKKRDGLGNPGRGGQSTPMESLIQAEHRRNSMRLKTLQS